MGSLVELECFKFQNNPFVARLSIEQDRIFCPIRGGNFLVRPEELIRQSLVSFLTNSCAEYPSVIDIVVEHECMDIALYLNFTDDIFTPNVPPILIIETKRSDIYFLDTDENKNQLIGYLNLKKCETGILFNGNSAFVYERIKEDYSKKEIFDFSEILELIRKRAEKQRYEIDSQQQHFIKAIEGSFDSFQELIKIHGLNANSTITFLYQRNKQLLQASGFLFKNEGNEILFRNRGFYNKGRLSITKQEFRRLVSIKKLA